MAEESCSCSEEGLVRGGGNGGGSSDGGSDSGGRGHDGGGLMGAFDGGDGVWGRHRLFTYTYCGVLSTQSEARKVLEDQIIAG